MTVFKRAARFAVASMAVGVLVACGGGGGGDGGPGPGGGGGTQPYVLFASDNIGDLAAFTTLSPAAGTAITAHLVEKIQYTGNTMVYDAGHDELYLLYENVSSPAVQLQVFAHASTLKADAAPSRTLVLPDLFYGEHMVLDTQHDRLWITGSDVQHISAIGVYDHISTASGTVAVSRLINAGSHDIAVDAGRDILYLNSFGNEVEVYLNASTLHGSIQVDHVIRGMSSSDGIVLDATHDRLYTRDTGGSNVYVLQNASTTMTGTQSTIALPTGTYLMSLAVDGAHDRLYAGAQDAAFVIDNVGTLSGAAPAVKVPATGVVVTAFAFAGQ